MPTVSLTAFDTMVAQSFSVDWDAAAAGWGATPNGDTGTHEAASSNPLFDVRGLLTDDGTTIPLDAILSAVSLTYTWAITIEAASPLELDLYPLGAMIDAPGASGSADEDWFSPGMTRADLFITTYGWTLRAFNGSPDDGRLVINSFTVHVTYTLPGPPSTVPTITLNTLDARAREGLTIQDALNDAPNTCSLTVESATSPLGQSVRIAVNPGAVLLHNGTIQTVTLTYDLDADQIRWDCTGTDDLAQFNRRLPFGAWEDISATTVAEELIAAYAPSFSDAGIEAGLPNVTITLDGSTTLSGAFAQMAALFGGAFKVEDGVVYLFLTDTADPPDDIDDTPGRFLDDPPITMTVDLSQIRTRVFVEGQIGTTGPAEAGVVHTGFGTATSTGQAGGGMLGALIVAYAITHVTDRGETHASGTGDNIVTFAGGEGSVLLENLDSTISVDDRVTDRRLYRSRAGSQYPYYFLTSLGIAPAVNDTYVDAAANDALGAQAPSHGSTAFTPTPTVWAEVNDLAAQAALAALEGGGSDGIAEVLVRDSNLTTTAEAITRGEAELALFAYPLVTVTYATRDVKSKSGKTVHVDVTTPPISGDFLIQAVAISDLDLDGGPRFLVTASSVRFTLAAILRMALEPTGSSGGGSGRTGSALPATLPAVSGVNLTALNASNLASGTVPDARFPATLPAASGVNLTNLDASDLASGTVPDGRFPATLPAASGVNLTALNGSNIASGTVADARLSSLVPIVAGAAPVDNQVAVWTAANGIEGTPSLTWTGNDLTFTRYAGDPSISMRRANGALGAETGLLAGNQMGGFQVNGWSSAGAFVGTSAIYTMFAEENFTGTAQGTRCEIYTKTVGTTTLVKRLTIGHNVLLGAAGKPTTGTDGIVFPDGTALATMAANTAGLFGDDLGGTTVMRGIWEDGTVGTLGLVVTKTTTGDPTPHEGLFVINTIDNTVKVYADGAWRTLASGW